MHKIRYKYKSIVVSQTPIKYELMPIIPITIQVMGKMINVEALIDSGANRCFCQLEIGEVLGIPLASCPKEAVGGIGGAGEILMHKLMIDIEHGTFKFPAQVGFGRFNFHGFSFILGQKDFFENIDVLFQRRKETIEITLP